MLAVEGVVVGPSTTVISTTNGTGFPSSATMTMPTTGTVAAAAAPPTVVAAAAAAGVGLLPMVTVATAAGDADPRSLLVPVPAALGGSNPNPSSSGPVVVAGGATTTTSTTTSNSGSANNNNTATATNAAHNNASSANPSTMEQAEEFVKPIIKDGEILLEVECGQNKAAMYLSKLCQGSKGPCISFQGSWLTPNEFQFVSGRETAKDWKRSIRHHGKSLKLLLAKGILAVHPTMCDCEGCRIGAVLTRKGEKRRIPNGERKRKPTGNSPENSGNGAFRTVANLAAGKNQDGPPDPKRPALDRALEGNQSPLKESSMLNLPPEAKEALGARQVDAHTQDVSKLVVDSRLPPAVPVVPVVVPITPTTSERNMAAIGHRLPPAAHSPPQEHKGTCSPPTPRPLQGSLSSPVSPAADVKVLSSSSSTSSSTSAAAINALDKSLSRLALYHAASASLKGTGVVAHPPRSLSVPKSDKPNPLPRTSSLEQDRSGSPAPPVKDDLGQSESKDSTCGARSPSPQPKADEAPVSEEAAANQDTAVSDSEPRAESKDPRSEDSSPGVVISHSVASQVKLSEPNNNHHSSISISVSTPVSLPASVAALTSPVVASAAPAASDSLPPTTESSPRNLTKDAQPKAAEASSSATALISPSLLSPSHKHSEKEGHITIRHPSPERAPQGPEPPAKPSPVKAGKEHTAEKHRDRKPDCTSSPPEHKDRQGGKDSKEGHVPRHSHERDPDRRRLEERAERDRKAGCSSGQGGKGDDAGGRGAPDAPVAGGGGRVEGIPTTAHVVPPVPVPAPVADAAAFSEYMRLLAAGHNGFVPPSLGCLPGMFPLRPPADASLNPAAAAAAAAAMMHPMQAAACGMFSSPTALLPKDPVMYPTSAGGVPSASYYGAPGMTPLPLIPHQYSTAPSAPVVDYSRPFPYLSWPGGLSLMMPDAMNAAAVAAATAGSSAKRSREEMESGMDKRLSLPVPPYAMGSVAPMDYMAAYRGLATPLSCGMESSMYEKNAELLRKRLYPDMSAGVGGSGASKNLLESPYLASLPEYFRILYCCPCMENRPGDIRTWPVEEVVKLVSSLEGCSVYSEIFREQRVTGRILVLLTADSLMKNLGMKLGPAVTLTSRVAKLLMESTRSSGCNMCQRLASMVPVVQGAVGYS